MGAKIFGNWSRGNAQKSLSLFARGEYGFSSLSYKLLKIFHSLNMNHLFSEMQAMIGDTQ